MQIACVTGFVGDEEGLVITTFRVFLSHVDSRGLCHHRDIVVLLRDKVQYSLCCLFQPTSNCSVTFMQMHNLSLTVDLMVNIMPVHKESSLEKQAF